MAVLAVTEIADDNLFFDTKLLLLAAHNVHRIHKVPADWIVDPASRVHLSHTAAEAATGTARSPCRQPTSR